MELSEINSHLKIIYDINSTNEEILSSVITLIKLYEGNDDKLFELHNIIIKLNNITLAESLGILYFNGTKIPRDYIKARELLELVIFADMSANLNTVYFILVKIYRDGLGTDINNEHVIELIIRAKTKDNYDDHMDIILGDIYFDNKSGIGDQVKAFELYMGVFNKGILGVIPLIVRAYYNGFGTNINYEKAMEFSKLMPDTDNEKILHLMAVMYEKGYGIDADLDKAIELYKSAYNKGNLTSIQSLCRIYKLYKDIYQSDAINYFVAINKTEYIKEIYKYDGYLLSILVEYSTIKEKNNHLKSLLDELTTYVLETPDGELYFEFDKQHNIEKPMIIKSNDQGKTSFKLAQMYELGRTPFKKDCIKAMDLYKLSYIQGNYSAIEYLCNIYTVNIIAKTLVNSLFEGETDSTNIFTVTRQIEMINYLLDINRPDKIKFITTFDDYIINILSEHYNFKKENVNLDTKINKLLTHIKASPDGEFYLTAHENWKLNLNK